MSFLTTNILASLQNSDGSFDETVEHDIRVSMRYYGCADSCRLFLWKCCLRLNEFTDPESVRQENDKKRRDEYQRLRDQWAQCPSDARAKKYTRSVETIR